MQFNFKLLRKSPLLCSTLYKSNGMNYSRHLCKVQIQALTHKGIITKTNHQDLRALVIFFIQIFNLLISHALVLNKIRFFLSRADLSFI